VAEWLKRCVCGLRLLGPIYTASLAVSLVGKGLRGIRMYQGYVILKFLEGSPVGSLLDSTPL